MLPGRPDAGDDRRDARNSQFRDLGKRRVRLQDQLRSAALFYKITGSRQIGHADELIGDEK